MLGVARGCSRWLNEPQGGSKPCLAVPCLAFFPCLAFLPSLPCLAFPFSFCLPCLALSLALPLFAMPCLALHNKKLTPPTLHTHGVLKHASKGGGEQVNYFCHILCVRVMHLHDCSVMCRVMCLDDKALISASCDCRLRLPQPHSAAWSPFGYDCCVLLCVAAHCSPLLLIVAHC